MKKLFYYLAFILLLFLISNLKTSAKEIDVCIRSENDLKVKEEFIHDNNLDDIMLTPCVNSEDKIYDFANIIDDSKEDELFKEIEEFSLKTNYEIVLVTTNENKKGEASIYADDFYDYNNFGKNKTRDGLLLLIDLDTRELYISTTGDAIKMFSDRRLNDILDYGYEYITGGDYYNTFSSMIKRVDYHFSLGYPSENKNMIIDESGKPIIIKYMNYSLITFISGIITLIIAIIFYFKSRLKIKVTSTISYLNEKNITLKNDRLVNSIITHHIRSNDTSSGSSSGSGSSYHSSSSGSFHGGAGRHF